MPITINDIPFNSGEEAKFQALIDKFMIDGQDYTVVIADLIERVEALETKTAAL